MVGVPIPYRWEIEGDDLTITTEVIGATFHGRWSADGTTFSGGWRPDPGREGPGNDPYDISERVLKRRSPVAGPGETAGHDDDHGDVDHGFVVFG